MAEMASHNPSPFGEVVQPFQDTGLEPLGTALAAAFRGRSLAIVEGLLFHLHVNGGVFVSGVHVGMTQPVLDHAEVVSGLE